MAPPARPDDPRPDDPRPWVGLRPYAPAFVLAAATIAAAPVLGLVRDALFERFSERAVYYLAVVLGACAVVVFAWACAAVWRRIRTRPSAWLGLAAIGVLVWIQVHGFSIGIPSSDVAEKIHIFQYGLLAILLYRAEMARAARSPVGEPAGITSPSIWIPVLGATLVGVFDESTQGFFQLRTGDVRDIALDALAGLTGLLFALLVLRSSGSQADGRDLAEPRRFAVGRTTGSRRSLRLASITVLGLGLFIHQAHLGHVVDDPQIGRFVSWFAAEELERLQADRAARWAAEPPTLRPWNPEDYYLTEAAWHTNHRNKSRAEGDLWLATQANRVLERYYRPFLDLDSFRDGGANRWHEDDRLRMESEHPAAPDRYVSPVLQERLWTGVPQVPWLVATLVVSAVLWFWPLRRGPSGDDAGRPAAEDFVELS